MRTSLVLPDEVIATIRERAEAEGISQSEWLRRVVVAGCNPTAEPVDSGALQAAQDALRDAITRAERVEAVLSEKNQEIAWLRGEVSKLNDKLTPQAITGPARRYFWQVWRPRGEV